MSSQLTVTDNNNTLPLASCGKQNNFFGVKNKGSSNFISKQHATLIFLPLSPIYPHFEMATYYHAIVSITVENETVYEEAKRWITQ